jgi:hypothetical protein
MSQRYWQYQDSNEKINQARMRTDKFVFHAVSGLAFLSKFVELVSLDRSVIMYREVYQDTNEDLTRGEIDQVNQSRKQIAEGRSKKFANIEEYLKSLDADENP